MKTLTTLALAGLFASLGGVSAGPLHHREHYEEKFYTWMLKHKIHIPAGHEFVRRLENFIENSDWIETHNKGNYTYKLGHNQFSHMTYDEFKQVYLGWKKPALFEEDSSSTTSMTRRNLKAAVNLPVEEDFLDTSGLPASIDWVEKGKVTSVKDQGSCGSCYTFSATGAIESAYAIKTGQVIDLSEQQVVDCDSYDGGCQGGEMQNVFQYANKNGGLCLWEDYPYESGKTQTAGECRSKSCQVVPGTAPQSWKSIRPHVNYALQYAVAQQPVAVAVAASRDWMFYSEGIFNGACERQLNHGILAVGYGSSPQGDYWKVKNSWSTAWGVDGYIYIARDGSATSCGILNDASYPVLGNEVAISTASLAKKGTASAHDCGGSTAVFTKIVITPANVQKNQLITLQASGFLNKPLKSGSYTLKVKYAGAELYSHTGNVCGDEQVQLPLGAGTINLYGLKCPSNPGPVTYGLDVVLPTIAPSGSYDILITAKDQDGTKLMCIDTKLSL